MELDDIQADVPTSTCSELASELAQAESCETEQDCIANLCDALATARLLVDELESLLKRARGRADK